MLKSPLKFSLGKALETWSDFAIECWVYAIRLAFAFLVMFYLWGLTGRWNDQVFGNIAEHWQGLFAFIFAGGIVAALCYRLDRAFSREKKRRGPQLSGGRTAPTRRPKRRQWGNRKRKRKPKT